MIEELQEALAKLCRELFGDEVKADVSRTDEQYGDYASNAALQLAGKLGKTTREIAERLSSELQKLDSVEKAEVAGPGFINITLSKEVLQSEVAKMQSAVQSYGASDRLAAQTIVAEYSDPNPFKILHAGHLYTSIVGDAIANLLENAGATVHRVNFGGDVGLHVGKTMWAIIRYFSDDMDEDKAWAGVEGLIDKPLGERIAFISRCYVEGNNAYETDEQARPQIEEYNQRVYKLLDDDAHESSFAQIYWNCREWSYRYFDEFYAMIGSQFEKYYPESETAPLGLTTVQEHLGKVYEVSDGAVIFKGEKYGLHTRVFVNSQGLPTYEAKDVGLIMKKWQDYHYDRSVIITGNDIVDYMQVVLKSIEQFAPELSERTTHLTHGIVKLPGGVKMSSRLGNILGATDIINLASAANKELTGSEDFRVTLGAVKYAFLKQRLGGDIIYDPAESVSIEGNSGPYLQYAYVRARSILEKSKKLDEVKAYNYKLDESERGLVRKLTEYKEVINKATIDLTPHHIATYLYELAQEFNRFYEKNRVIGSDRELDRLTLVTVYAGILADGLRLLGIEAPEKM